MCRQSRDLYRPYRDTAQARQDTATFRAGPGLRARFGGVTGSGFADKSPSWVLPWSGRLVSISKRHPGG